MQVLKVYNPRGTPAVTSACHTVQVMHSDIKSRNVFLTKTKDVAKIGDVGVAQFLSSTVHDDRVSCASHLSAV